MILRNTAALTVFGRIKIRVRFGYVDPTIEGVVWCRALSQKSHDACLKMNKFAHTIDESCFKKDIETEVSTYTLYI